MHTDWAMRKALDHAADFCDPIMPRECSSVLNQLERSPDGCYRIILYQFVLSRIDLSYRILWFSQQDRCGNEPRKAGCSVNFICFARATWTIHKCFRPRFIIPAPQEASTISKKPPMFAGNNCPGSLVRRPRFTRRLHPSANLLGAPPGDSPGFLASRSERRISYGPGIRDLRDMPGPLGGALQVARYGALQARSV